MKVITKIGILSSLLFFTVISGPSALEKQESDSLVLTGKWIVEMDGELMRDPQTSGLTFKNGYLYSISDGSAHDSQRRRLHQINPSSAQVINKFGPFMLSSKLENSCFAGYLNSAPDYEALAPIPGEKNAWLLVTEDARRSPPMTEKCINTYKNTGSTIYPTLLVKVELIRQQFVITGIRPIKYDSHFAVGNFPNDGVEGLAIDSNKNVYLAVEKDEKELARIFMLTLTDNFWQHSDFVDTSDPNVKMPLFEAGNHPINGIDLYFNTATQSYYIIAAARNDNQLWIIDTTAKKEPYVVSLAFKAPTFKQGNECDATIEMNNASIEGVAVVGEQLWLVNDPWKVNYSKNIQCRKDTKAYEMNAPLLFNVAIDPAWFK